MKKIRYHKSDKRKIHTMYGHLEFLQIDLTRRLKNALLAMSELDPGWMIWVERHLPPHMMTMTTVRLVEMRARELLVKKTSLFTDSQKRAIIKSDIPFSDSGNLCPG